MSPEVAKRIAHIPPSGIRRFFDIAATMKVVISRGIGEPDFVPPEPVLEAGIASLRRGETHYTSNSGILELRQALCDHLLRRYALRYNPADEIIIPVGVSEARYLALGGGGETVYLATRVEDSFQVTAEDIERAITPRTKAVLIGYPNNPTGAVMSRAALEQVAELAERRNLFVISDEIYDRLVYGVEHVCFASLPRMRERTITLGGFSKAYAMTGWRIGYAAAPAGHG